MRLGLISVLPNAFPLVIAAGTLVLLGRDLQIASAIAFTVCLGIAVDDTIHFLARYRRELQVTDDVGEAVVRAFLGVSAPMLITTSILLAGFAILFLSTIPTTQLFAGICMLGMAAALVGDLVLLPALVVVFARRTGS
jgi:predicted RND superfamily exporter protein